MGYLEDRGFDVERFGHGVHTVPRAADVDHCADRVSEARWLSRWKRERHHEGLAIALAVQFARLIVQPRTPTWSKRMVRRTPEEHVDTPPPPPFDQAALFAWANLVGALIDALRKAGAPNLLITDFLADLQDSNAKTLPEPGREAYLAVVDVLRHEWPSNDETG